MSLNDTIRFLLAGGRARQIRELYDLVRPLGLPGLRKIRVGNPLGDGGYVMVDDFDGITAALSLGIGRDISWDLQMAGMGVEIHQFDCISTAAASPGATIPRTACAPSATSSPATSPDTRGI